MRCPQCQTDLTSPSASCAICGWSLNDEPTRHLDTSKPIDRSPSFDSIDNARFVPGTILADRYRIVGLLGRGGMGEVYRADDL